MTLPATKTGLSPGLTYALCGSLALHGMVLFALPVSPPAQGVRSHIMQAHLLPASADNMQQHNQPDTGNTKKTITPTTPASLTPVPTPSEPLLANTQVSATSSGQIATTAVSETSTSDANTYFSNEQLDVPPHMLGEVQQVYPARARAAAVEGYVTLSLLINEHGEVEDVQVVKAQPGGYFEASALAMLRNQRFSPPIKHNQAVKSRWLTTVRYRLQG